MKKITIILKALFTPPWVFWVLTVAIIVTGLLMGCTNTPDPTTPVLNHHNIYLRLQVADNLLDKVLESDILGVDEEHRLIRLWMDASDYFLHDDLRRADLVLKQFANSPELQKYLDREKEQ